MAKKDETIQVPEDVLPGVQEEVINESPSPEVPDVPVNEEPVTEGNTEVVEGTPVQDTPVQNTPSENEENVYDPEDFYNPDNEVPSSEEVVSPNQEETRIEGQEQADGTPFPKAIPEDEDPNAEPISQPIRTNTPAKIGLVNRTNKAIAVYLRRDSFMLGPSARTGLDYTRNEIKSVNHLTLNQAVAKGLVAILRG